MSDEQPVLGPLQPIWDSWTPQQDFIDGLPDIYFRNVITIQFNEIDDHVEAGNPPEKVHNEIVDIMSICLNWLRSKGLDDQGVAAAITARAPKYSDTGEGTAAIIERYNRVYGL